MKPGLLENGLMTFPKCKPTISHNEKNGNLFTYFQGERLKYFPEALNGIIGKENVSYYDATRGGYGNKGLTKDCRLEITGLVKEAADKAHRGRLTNSLCGGSSRATAAYTVPRVSAPDRTK